MKRFRFPLDALLAMRRRKLQTREAALAQLEARRAGALDRAQSCEQSATAARESLDAGLPLRGSDLRLAASASEAMLLQSRAWRQRAALLLREADEMRRDALAVRREVETLESMRERSLAEWRRGVDREEEALAAELYLARFSMRADST